MDFLDNLKDKASDLAAEHGDKIEGGIDKAAELIDEKTGGQHRDKIDQGAEKAKDLLQGLADDKAVDDK